VGVVGLWERLDLGEELWHQGLLRDFLWLLQVGGLSKLREVDVGHG
jgi:hypothetical protein